MLHIKKYFERIDHVERVASASALIGDCKRLAAVAAISVLIMLPAEARQLHRQIGFSASICNNARHCMAHNALTSMLSSLRRRSRTRNAIVGEPGTKAKAAGVIVSSKTGAHARVGIVYAARFQAYIDDLENNYGVRVLFMGGLRPGRCSMRSQHPCGKALDVCQHRRGVVDPSCHLPGRAELGKIAASHGLFEGGRWCNSDYGHAQVDESVSWSSPYPRCAAIETATPFSVMFARRFADTASAL